MIDQFRNAAFIRAILLVGLSTAVLSIWTSHWDALSSEHKLLTAAARLFKKTSQLT